MFHKPRLIKIYTSREYVYILRSIFLMIGSYFFVELYQAFDSGEILARRGEVFSRENSPIRFYLEAFYNFTFMVINLYLIVVFRVNPEVTDIEEEK